MKIKLATATLLCSLLLGSCVESALTVAEGGMSGTGISTGRITGFGSIYVNGIHYDVSQAAFYRDGKTASGQDAFNVGEVVTISGDVAANGVDGKAIQVTFDSLLVGEVTVPATDGQSLTVMGQAVQTDDLSILHGIEQLADLQVGDVVEISGVRDADGVITAASITLLPGRKPQDGLGLKLEGRISGLLTEQASFQLGNLFVDYSLAQLEGFLPGQTLAEGQYVEVETRQPLQGMLLVAARISLKRQQPDYPAATRLRLEGLVTALDAADRFTLNGQPVVTGTATQFIDMNATDLALNMALEVEGTINQVGELLASRVMARHVHGDGRVVRLEGAIVALQPTQQTLTLADGVLQVDNASMLLFGRDADRRQTTGSFAALQVGDYVRVEAIPQNDGSLRVLRLEWGNSPQPADAFPTGIAPPVRGDEEAPH